MTRSQDCFPQFPIAQRQCHATVTACCASLKFRENIVNGSLPRHYFTLVQTLNLSSSLTNVQYREQKGPVDGEKWRNCNRSGSRIIHGYVTFGGILPSNIVERPNKRSGGSAGDCCGCCDGSAGGDGDAGAGKSRVGTSYDRIKPVRRCAISRQSSEGCGESSGRIGGSRLDRSAFHLAAKEVPTIQVGAG